jgi:hypothetical protein
VIHETSTVYDGCDVHDVSGISSVSSSGLLFSFFKKRLINENLGTSEYQASTLVTRPHVFNSCTGTPLAAVQLFFNEIITVL